MAIENIFIAESLIVDRLTLALKDAVKTVGTADDLAGVTNIAKLCDAVFVVPGRSDVTDYNRLAVNEEQDWQVTIAVAHYDRRNTTTTALKAGEIAKKVFAALHDCRLDVGWQKMKYTGRGDPYFDEGYAEFPLFFTVKAVFRAT